MEEEIQITDANEKDDWDSNLENLRRQKEAEIQTELLRKRKILEEGEEAPERKIQKPNTGAGGAGIVRKGMNKDGEAKEEDKKRYFELLEENNIDQFSLWDKCLPKLVVDPRFNIIPSMKLRKKLFDQFTRSRAQVLLERKNNGTLLPFFLYSLSSSSSSPFSLFLPPSLPFSSLLLFLSPVLFSSPFSPLLVLFISDLSSPSSASEYGFSFPPE